MARRERAQIVGRRVAAFFPARGPIVALLVGEAPGPRGADRSGIPFWGDRSGKLLYRALAQAGLAEVPEEAFAEWEGARLAARGLAPRLFRVALSNALSFCPTRDGRSFCAPSRAELNAADNRARLLAELDRAARRCPERLLVIALGRKAESLLSDLSEEGPPFTLRYLPHPSARVLARGRPGETMAERERAWQERLLALIAAGGGASSAGPARPPATTARAESTSAGTPTRRR